MASGSIVSTSFKLISEYDNTGIKLAMADVDASKKMIAGMSAFGMPNNNDMISKLSAWTNSKAAADAAELKSKQDIAAADKAFWLERARMRDKDLKDQIQADNIARTSRENSIKEEQRKRTEMIMATVREQQAAAMAINRLIPDAQIGGVAQLTRGGNFDARNFQQLGYMVQDFSSQMQNAKTAAEGAARGVMAISNNIQMMGIGLPPMQQAMISMGGAAIGIVVPAVIHWLNDTKALEDKTKNIEESYKRMGSLIEGIQQGHILGAGGMDEAEKAKAQLDSLTTKISGMSRTSLALKDMILQEMGGENRPDEIAALQKHQNEITENIKKAEAERAGIQRVWTGVKLRDSLKAIEEEKKLKKANAVEEEDGNKFMADLKRQQAEEARAEDEKIRRQYDVRQFDLRNKIEDLQRTSLNPSSAISASVSGSQQAASAINRALMGTRSEENDRKQQIRLLEDQLRVLNRLEQKLNFKKAGLGA